MPEKKKQHYIPKFYMRLFTNDNKFLAVNNVLTKKIYDRVPYENQCYKDYFYGKDGVLENQLSNMETEWSIIIKKALNKEVLSDNDLNSLKKFALYQRQRTLAEEMHNIQTRKEIMVVQAKMYLENKGIEYDDKIVEEICSEYVSEKITPAETLQFSNEYLNEISDLNVVIIEYQTQQELFSSDAPVVSINPFHQPSIGYACMGLIMLFPISPHMIVVIFDKKMYPLYKEKQYVTLCNENEVLNLNILQLISAEKILFGTNSQVFSKINSKHWDIREKNRKNSGVSSFGSKSEKLICMSMRSVILNHSFSFGKVHTDFTNIPFACREAVPRKWDEKWEKKLNDKPQVMLGDLEIQTDILKRMGKTKKEYKRGLEDMAKSAKKYWLR